MKTLKIGRSKLIKYSLLLGSIFLFAITFPPLSTDVSAAKLTESNCESSGGMWRGNVPPGECAFTDGYGDTIVKDTGDLKSSYYTVNGKCYTGYKFISSSATGNAKGTCEKDSNSGNSSQDKLTTAQYIDGYKKTNTDITEDDWTAIAKTCKDKTGTDAKSCVDTEMTAIKNNVKEDPESVSTCAVDGIGWILCPVIRALAGMADGMYDMAIQPLLEINSSYLFNTDNSPDQGTSLYEGWRSMRDLANIILVIFFMIVIFSQITGYGISNYGIKKMLPKLIVIAVIINISWYVCAICVDISNILGSSLQTFFSGSAGEQTPNLTATSQNILAGTAVAGISAALIIANIGALGVALLVGVISIAVALLTILLREMVIVILILFSPVAIVLMAFPGTEGVYKKWKSTFWAMLIMYPIIGFVFGVTGYVSSILSGAFSGGGGASGFIQQIGSALILLVPTAAIPFITSWSLKQTSIIGGTLTNGLSRAGGWGKKRAETGSLGQIKRAQDQKRSLERRQANYGAYKGWSPLRRGRSELTSLALRGGSKVPGLKGIATASLASGAGESSDEEAKNIKDRQILYSGQINSGDSLISLAQTAVNNKDTSGIKALQNIAYSKGDGMVDELIRQVITPYEHSLSPSQRSQDKVINALKTNAFDGKNAAVTSKNVDIKEWAKKLDDNRSIQEVSQSADTWQNISNEAAASMPDAAVKRSFNQNTSSYAFDPTIAAETNSNPNLTPKMDKKLKDVFQEISGTPAAQPAEQVPNNSSNNQPVPVPNTDADTNNIQQDNPIAANDIPSGYTQRESGFIIPREENKRSFNEPNTRIHTNSNPLDDNHNRPDNTNP